LYSLRQEKKREGGGYRRSLILCKDDKYLTSVTSKDIGISKRALLEKLKLKVDLVLDWEQLYFNLLYKKCEWCGNVFEKKKKNQKYCSKNCSYEATLENNRVSRRKRQQQTKEMKRRIIHETINNKGYLPTGFQEFDNNGTMGISNLTGHIAENMEKEQELIQKELKRFKLVS
jgi:hypothetical protein